MDTLSQEMFENILKMDKDTLDTEQLGFLMARRGYMNDEQRARFAKEIKLHEAGKLFSQDEETEEEDEEEGDEPTPAKKKVAKKK